MIIWKLFISFVKIGVLTFGGGMAMLPMLERECVKKNNWVSGDELLDYFAIGQCTPGIIAVNTATLVGFKEKKYLGAIVATVAVTLPSVLIIIALASVLSRFQNNIYVLKAFAGIRISVCALILDALTKLAKKAVKNLSHAVIAVLSLGLQIFLGVSPVIIVICTIVYGITVYYFRVRKKEVEK